jgi:hypothetical protein
MRPPHPRKDPPPDRGRTAPFLATRERVIIQRPPKEATIMKFSKKQEWENESSYSRALAKDPLFGRHSGA